MQVHVKLFANLSRFSGDMAPGAPLDVEVPDGATIADLVNRLNLPHEQVKIVFVNGRARPMDWSLGLGDEVGLFPLIGGG